MPLWTMLCALVHCLDGKGLSLFVAVKGNCIDKSIQRHSLQLCRVWEGTRHGCDGHDTVSLSEHLVATRI